MEAGPLRNTAARGVVDTPPPIDAQPVPVPGQQQCCQPSRPSVLRPDGDGRKGRPLTIDFRPRPCPAVIGRHPLMICESSYIIDIQL